MGRRQYQDFIGSIQGAAKNYMDIQDRKDRREEREAEKLYRLEQDKIKTERWQKNYDRNETRYQETQKKQSDALELSNKIRKQDRLDDINKELNKDLKQQKKDALAASDREFDIQKDMVKMLQDPTEESIGFVKQINMQKTAKALQEQLSAIGQPMTPEIASQLEAKVEGQLAPARERLKGIQARAESDIASANNKAEIDKINKTLKKQAVDKGIRESEDYQKPSKKSSYRARIGEDGEVSESGLTQEQLINRSAYNNLSKWAEIEKKASKKIDNLPEKPYEGYKGLTKQDITQAKEDIRSSDYDTRNDALKNLKKWAEKLSIVDWGIDHDNPFTE